MVSRISTALAKVSMIWVIKSLSSSCCAMSALVLRLKESHMTMLVAIMSTAATVTQKTGLSYRELSFIITTSVLFATCPVCSSSSSRWNMYLPPERLV